MAGAEPDTSGDRHADAPLTVERSTHDGRDRITVRGELDAFTASHLRAGIDAATAIHVDLDLGGVTFIDSSGLAMVVESHQRLAHDERRLVIVSRSPIVERLLDLSGLASRLDLDAAR
jgi:anti-sigma B factor antagonist